MRGPIYRGSLLAIGMLTAAAASAAGNATAQVRANYDIRFEAGGERQDLRGMTVLAAASDHVLVSSDWSAILRLTPLDCETYRLELEAVRGAPGATSLDLRPRLAVAGTGRYGAPLTLAAERAGLAVDAAFAIGRPPDGDGACPASQRSGGPDR